MLTLHEVFSGIQFDMLIGIYCDILSDICSNILSDIKKRAFCWSVRLSLFICVRAGVSVSVLVKIHLKK